MAANQTYKPSEGKREEFRRYLEKTGVMDALTKVLVSLYEEADKPNDALTYILNKLAVQCGGETIDALKTRLQEANDKVDQLQKENQALKGGEDAGEDQQAGQDAPAPAADAPPDAAAPAPDAAPADAAPAAAAPAAAAPAAPAPADAAAADPPPAGDDKDKPPA